VLIGLGMSIHVLHFIESVRCKQIYHYYK
jgi:hypothetical protein